MSEGPTKKQIILWYLRRQGVIGSIRFASWLCFRPRYYVRVLSAAKRLVPFRRSSEQVDHESAIPVDLACETARFVLRPLKTSDLDAVADLLPPDASWRDELSFASELLESWLTMVAVSKDSQEIVGMYAFTIFDIDGQVEYELGYRVHFDQFGKGYATEGALALRDLAFDQLKLDRLISLIEPSNLASIRVAEKNGMRREREWMLQNHLVYVYGVNRTDVV